METVILKAFRDRRFRLPARIVGLCDSYDALTHEKAYRRAFTSDEAIRENHRLRELQFDPHLVDLFVPMITSLRSEHGDLDEFLGAAARETALNAARQKIAESLAKPIAGFECPNPNRPRPPSSAGSSGARYRSRASAPS